MTRVGEQEPALISAVTRARFCRDSLSQIVHDAERALSLTRMSAQERKDLRRALSAVVRRRINGWLATHPDCATMPREAAAFMYLLEAFEELA